MANNNMGSIRLIANPSEIGAGTRGTSASIDAVLKLLETSLRIIRIQDENYMLEEPLIHEHAKRLVGILKVYERISEEVFKTLKEGDTPIMLTADHSNAGGTIAGLKRYYSNERLGVIWIDAHADLHTPYTTPSGNVHGMPLAVSISEDNFPNKLREPAQETLELWERLKNVGIAGAKIKGEDIVFIGLRDVEHEEKTLMEKHNMLSIEINELRSKGIDEVVQRTLKRLAGCDRLYISFDVDSLDPSVSKGTGTSVPDGLFQEEAEQLIEKLLQDERVCCFEITEINPSFDLEKPMEKVGTELLSNSINTLEKVLQHNHY
ncbi:MAG: arginase [Bacteroidetes bacterium]|nr:arginase [Bacteroidota bacterium]